MTVYQGTLRNVSDGKVVSTDSGYWTIRWNTIRYHKDRDRQEGFVRRAFVEIGDTQIRNVMLSPLYDELLMEAIGKEVALSIDGPPGKPNRRHTVIALRTPSAGLMKPPFAITILALFVLVFKNWLTAFVLGGLVSLVGWLALGLIGAAIGLKTAGIVVGIGLGAAVCLFFLVKPFQIAYSSLRLRAALDAVP